MILDLLVSYSLVTLQDSHCVALRQFLIVRVQADAFKEQIRPDHKVTYLGGVSLLVFLQCLVVFKELFHGKVIEHYLVIGPCCST